MESIYCVSDPWWILHLHFQVNTTQRSHSLASPNFIDGENERWSDWPPWVPQLKATGQMCLPSHLPALQRLFLSSMKRVFLSFPPTWNCRTGTASSHQRASGSWLGPLPHTRFHVYLYLEGTHRHLLSTEPIPVQSVWGINTQKQPPSWNS